MTPLQQAAQRLTAAIEALEDGIKGGLGPGYENGHGIEVGTELQAARQEMASALAQAGEPFGYFKALPFGWTDCAEMDEGAIALYTAPQDGGRDGALARTAANIDKMLGRENARLWIVGGNTAWSPVDDDADAFRLAVDLRIKVEFSRDERGEYTVAWDGYFGSGKHHHDDTDRRAATRLAIATIAARHDPKEHPQ